MAADSFEAGRKKGVEQAEENRKQFLSQQERKHQANARLKALSSKVRSVLRGKGYNIWISEAYALNVGTDILSIARINRSGTSAGDINISGREYGSGFDFYSKTDCVKSVSNIPEEKVLELVGIYFGATHKQHNEFRRQERSDTIIGIAKDILPIVLIVGFIVLVLSYLGG